MRPSQYVHPLNHTSFIEFPLENHPFSVDPNDDYRCLLCHRPRALHATPDDQIPESRPKPVKFANRRRWDAKRQ